MLNLKYNLNYSKIEIYYMTATQKEEEGFSIKYIKENIYHFKQCNKKSGSRKDPKSIQVQRPLRKCRKIWCVPAHSQ